MTMQAESLEVLEKAAVEPAQARAIVRAIEIEIAGARDTLATKHDLLLLRQDFQTANAQLRADFEKSNAQLRADFERSNSELRADFERSNTELRAEFQVAHADLRGELRAEIHAAVGGVIRQMYVAMIGQVAVMLGFTYFLVTQLR